MGSHGGREIVDIPPKPVVDDARFLASAAKLEWLGKEEHVGSTLDQLSRIIKGKDEKLAVDAVNILRDAVVKGLDPYCWVEIVERSLRYPHPKALTKPLWGVFEAFTSKYGLPPQVAHDWWTSQGVMDDTPFIQNLTYNAVVLSTLENQRPGASKALHKTYGISCFGRAYTTESLVRMYDTINEIPKTLGVVIMPKSGYPFLHHIRKEVDGLSKEFNVKCVEADTAGELAGRLNNVKKHHIKAHGKHPRAKARFAVVFGVIKGEGVYVGEPGQAVCDITKLLKDDSLFEISPSIVLVCSSEGTLDREKLSRQFKAEVTTPKGGVILVPDESLTGHPAFRQFAYKRQPDGSVKFDVKFYYLDEPGSYAFDSYQRE